MSSKRTQINIITSESQIYKIKTPCRLPIEEGHWKKLRSMVEKMRPYNKKNKIIFSVCVGVFSSSLFSLISFYCIIGIPTWAKFVNWLITIVSFLGGVKSYYDDKTNKEDYNISVNTILDEMDFIEQNYEKP
jgi:uncharacterized membrane protein